MTTTNKKNIVKEKQKISSEEGFWDNKENAEKILKEISSNNLWIESFDKLDNALSDLETLHEFFIEGEIGEEEIEKRIYDGFEIT